MLSDVKASQYIRLHFSGDVQKLRITISGMNGRILDTSYVALNTRVPLLFSWVRLLIMTMTVMILFILRPKSFVYRYKTNLRKTWQKVCMVVLLVVQATALWSMIHWNSDVLNWYKSLSWHKQYYELVDAFKSGHFYLDIQPTKELENMENPYDMRDRSMKGVSSEWDTAYYNRKYYCYFGAAPVLLLYLPYNLMTGKNLPNYIGAYIFSVLVMIGIMLLLWEVIKKWYRRTPFAMYLLLSVVFSSVSGLAYVAYRTDFYIIPNLSALAFSLFGLSLWLSAEKKSGELVPWKLAVGSLCIAMTAACRPQFLISAFFGVMLFWNYAFKERTLFSKKSVKQTIAVCLPFVIVGLLVMWYNFARFGSPFDFGANYNLTTNDMTHRGFVFGRTGLGIFTYFLQPFRMNSIFPFIHDFDSETVYQGLTLSEKLMGGILTLYPILLVGIFGMTQKKIFNDKREYKWCISR